MSRPQMRIRVDPTACRGHGACAALLPEVITLDEWGFPIVVPGPVPTTLVRVARRTVARCPALALTLAPIP